MTTKPAKSKAKTKAPAKTKAGKPRKPNNNKAITARKRAQGKDLGGRPRVVIDYDKLEKLCTMFCVGEECAAILGCSYETLNLRLKEDYAEALADLKPTDPLPDNRYDGFQDCFKKHSALGKASLRRSQFTMATNAKNPDKTMLIWLGKNYLEQSDRIDHSSKDGSMTPPRTIQRTIIDPKHAKQKTGPTDNDAKR